MRIIYFLLYRRVFKPAKNLGAPDDMPLGPLPGKFENELPGMEGHGSVVQQKYMMKKFGRKPGIAAWFVCLVIPFMVLTPLSGYANPIDDQASTVVCYGAPVSSITNRDQYLIRSNYAAHYLYRTKTAEYVCEHVTMKAITGSAKRHDDFRPDPEIPDSVRANLIDYSGENYDRGHLNPADDNTQTRKIMSESFLLSNIVPQNRENNRGIWLKLETLVRKWVKGGKDLYVITGTTYGKYYTKIGKDSVGVPSSIWKVIMDRKNSKSIGFLIPNAAVMGSDLPKYAVPIADIKKVTGITFFPKIPSDLSTGEVLVPKPEDWPGL